MADGGDGFKAALLPNFRLGHESPFPLRLQGTRMIVARARRALRPSGSGSILVTTWSGVRRRRGSRPATAQKPASGLVPSDAIARVVLSRCSACRKAHHPAGGLSSIRILKQRHAALKIRPVSNVRAMGAKALVFCTRPDRKTAFHLSLPVSMGAA